MDFRGFDEVILQRESHLLLHRERHDLVLGILKQHVDAPKALRRRQFAPVDQAPPGIGDQYASPISAPHVVRVDADQIERERALAGTAASENQHKGTRLHADGDILQSRGAYLLACTGLEPEAVFLKNEGHVVRGRRD